MIPQHITSTIYQPLMYHPSLLSTPPNQRLGGSMRQHLSLPTAMPKRNWGTTASTLVLHVFEPVGEVRNAAQAKTTTAQCCRQTVSRSISVRFPIPLMCHRGRGGGTYCVRLPFTNAVLVISLAPHIGQSTAVGVCCNEASGVAFW